MCNDDVRFLPGAGVSQNQDARARVRRVTSDEEIAAALPKLPPPAPARRVAAIAAALRRFDGPEERAGATTKPSLSVRPHRATFFDRPQAGLLVSAALIAVIGLPLGWLSLGPQPPSEGAPRPAMKAPAAKVDGPAAAADASVEVPTALPAEPRRGQPPVAAVGRGPANVVVPDPPPAAALPPPVLVADAGGARTDQSANKPVDLAMVSRREVIELRGRTANPSAPPPAQAAPPASYEADDSSIIVTGSRKSRGRPVVRGDWNACTVNDPRPNLERCKRLVDPKRPGAAGLAATHVAEGLSRAWNGDLSAAIGAFDQAIASDPRSSFAYLNRGLAFASRGDLDRAIADLDQVIRQEPRAARGYYNRSVLLRQRGDRRRADADAQRAVDLDSRYSEATGD